MVIREWNKFRRAMPVEDREYVDRLVGMAMRHSHEASYMASPEPVEPVFLSILVEMLMELDRVRGVGTARERLDVAREDDD